MPQKSKPFVIATEGQTIDGRHISRQWIEQMAKNYRPDIYTAVVNLEHLLSYHPDSAFAAYGKVTTLSTRETEIFGEKRLQLTATVEVADAAVAMQKDGKKCFASVEVIPNFTGRGEAYLTGLALTDSPASLGTEPMKFSLFTSGKADDVYVFAGETELAFTTPEAGTPLLDRVKELLSFRSRADAERFLNLEKAIEAIALAQGETQAKQAALFATAAEDDKRLASVETALADLTNKLAATAIHVPDRPAALGGSTLKTDC